MSDARLPISCWDTGKVSRDKINDSFNDLVTTVQWYEPTIVGWYWYIWGTATWVKAVWDNVEMKVDDWCIWYKSSSVNNWTSIIAIEDLKWDKWDTGDAATVCVGTVCTGAAWSDVCVTNSGTCHAAVLNFTIPQWATWCTGDTWARIYSAKFCGNDIVFTETNGCKVTIVWGKTELKGDQWCPWCNGCNGCNGCDWADWASICAAAFSGNDIVFTEDNGCTVTLANAKTCLKWADWVSATVSVGTTTTGGAGTCACVTNTGTCSAAVLDFVIPTGAEWPAWNGICCVTTSKSGKTTTVCMEYTSWEPTVFCVQDWADWQGSWDMSASTYDPCSCMADAFDYCNFYNTPTIPTDNCQLANWCGYTTCTGTLVAGDLTPYAKSCTLCTVATSWKYCDLTGSPTLCTVATSWKYCDLTGQPTIPTNNNQLTNGCGYTTCTGTITQVCMNWASCWTSGVINLGTVITDISWKQDTLTAWANVSIASNKICADNYFIVKESDACTTYTWEKWVAPYNTSYCYTNICINPDSWVVWKEGAIYSFDIDTWMIATSACRNVRVKIWSWAYIPVMWTSSILGWSSYFTKANIRQYQYSTKYQSWWALHLFTDSNTTYSAMSNAEATTWTCTSGRSIAACTLKCAINYYAPISDTAYWGSWDGQTWTAPSQNAVYDKINSMCVVPSGWSCWQVLTNTWSGCAWCAASWGDVLVSPQCCNILTSWMMIWAWCQCDYENLGTYDNNTVYLTI